VTKLKEIFWSIVGLLAMVAAGIALFVRGRKGQVSELKEEERKADNKISKLQGELKEIGKQVKEVRESNDENWHKHYRGPSD
jgi:peptidoglycan hydrolase CwlO-like protein